MEKLDGLKSYESYLELTNFSVCTQKMYLRTITNFYEWRLEQCKAGKLKQEDAQQFLLMRVKSGRSWSTINCDYSALRKYYREQVFIPCAIVMQPII